MNKPNVGMIGLAVMGSNLAQNMERNGYTVAVYNRSGDVTDQFMQRVKGKKFVASKTLEEFVNSMAAPRQIFIMVKAGAPVDAVIDSLLPLLSKGDIIIDGGNSYFPDTVRREKHCREAGINFMGIGISGGEEGALNGASLMPGGPKDAWRIMAPLLEKIAAKAPQACTAYIGPDGAGHFVKMVHNGIEYGDMQLIAEAYDMLRRVAGAKPEELSQIFERWNAGVLSSFLIEITAKIFRKHDEGGAAHLVDKILDSAGQKGTGRWTAQVALDLGVAIPGLAVAVDARILSSIKSERVSAAKAFAAPKVAALSGNREQFISAVHDALYCSKILSYAQGMALLAAASKEYKWDLKLNEIAALWKGGCIIRARFLDEIRKAYETQPGLPNLILDPALKREVERTLPNLRLVVQKAAECGVPCISFGASLAYFDSYRSADLPQNLTQAQRDFFGAHTYERVDKPGVFHTQWE
ncbi:MAG: NADP-dependent phosphogluconate dehydrogenase [Oligoflexia bacterium]|nr:NADP-dependent phosphogluconate dehydrogenase [Oligoflexia bacterium]